MKVLTVTQAKPVLGRLVDRALKRGRPVILRRGSQLVQISPYEAPAKRSAALARVDDATLVQRNTLGEESGPLR